MLGCEDGEIGDSLDEWLKWIHPEDVEEFKVKIYAHLEGLTPHFEHEHRMLHKAGQRRWMLTRGLAVRDGEGKAYRMAGSLTDITDRKNAEQQLLHDAFHDALTGLANRALFLDRLGQSMARSERKPGYHFAVLFLDLDRFKVINESLSHTIGDRLLVELADRIRGCLRPADTAARLGGDEFAILLEEIGDMQDAVGFAERINKAVQEPFTLEGDEVFTSASIGIALGSPGYERPEDLLRDADTAMYRAKALGRARHAMFDASMHTRAVALLQLETDLRRALEHNDFRVYYQPIVSLKTGKTAGFEALIRWIHPKRGIIMPMEFIPLAEETGLIIPIGRWVLQEACRQLRAWQTRHSRTVPLMISVNISGLQFLRPELIAQVDLLLRETGLDGADLKLEITESVIMENAEYAMDMLRQMKAQNIRLCIDDFGTGYSSMSYLRRYPIDTVKIDKSFTTRIDTDPESLEIVKTVVTMAHNLGKDIIAEGVETREQLAQIKALKCEYAQGFFFSKAVDCQAAESLISWRWYW
jgi:diguanylate cyclase (GGDEF)-like protein